MKIGRMIARSKESNFRLKGWYLMVLACMLSANVVLGQSVNFSFESKDVDQNESFSLPCTVTNFTKVGAFNFEVTWSPNVLEVTGFEALSNDLILDDGDFVLIPDEGKMVVTWLDEQNNDNGVSLADGDGLFAIKFTAVGGNGSSTTVGINENGNINFVVLSPTVQVLPSSQTPATVNVGEGQAGPTINFDMGSATGENNAFVTIPITVRNYKDVASFQYSVNFDPGFLEYDSNETLLSGLGVGDQASLTSKGQLVFQYAEPQNNPQTLPDNDVIARLRFKILATSGSSQVRFTSNPLEIKISGETAADLYNFSGSNGTVTVESSGNGGGCDQSGTAVYADVKNADPNTEVCVPIRVKDFNAAIIEGAIGWNNSVMTFVEIRNIRKELNTNNFKSDSLIFIWNSETTDNENLADGAVLFDACFRVTGSDGTSTQVGFNNVFCSDQDNNDIDIAFCNGAVNVGQGGSLNVSVTTNPPTCQNIEDGSIELALSNPSSYTYAWFSGSTQISSSQNLTGVKSGNYKVVITDGNGAQVYDRTITLEVDNPIRVTSSSIQNSTDGKDGSIQINVAGGAGQYSFLWSNGATSQNLTGVGGGSYTVTITDGSGCSYTSQAFVVGGESGSLNVSVTKPDFGGFNLKCHGDTDGMATLVFNGGSGPYSINFSQGDVQGDGPVYENLTAGVYKYTVRDSLGEEFSGEFEITEPPAIQATPEVTPDDGTGTGSVDLKASGGVGRLSYKWDDESGSTTAFLRNLEKGRYTVTIKDDNACTYVKRVYIPLEGETCFPTEILMTPNEDGKNDYLVFTCLSLFDQSTLSIYDRWGVLQYEISDYQNDWDGVDEDDNLLADGGYYYVLRLKDGDGIRSLYRGSVTIINKLR